MMVVPEDLTIEESYPFLIHSLMKYIERVKSKDRGAVLIDIIMDYARNHDVEPELIGDAIANDVYLKSFIEQDCRRHRMIKVIPSETDPLEEW